jgi:hypothetical protein
MTDECDGCCSGNYTDPDCSFHGRPRRPFEPHRDDEVAAWIERHRDEYRRDGGGRQADALDALLDEYREHADTGTPLYGKVQGPHDED